MLASNLAQAGATFSVAFKTKDRKMKQIAFPAAISALLAGVTEPAMYGVTLRLKKPMYAACLASGIGGFIIGLTQLKVFAFASPCLTSLVQFISPDGGNNFIIACVIAAVVFVLAFIFTFVVVKDQPVSETSNEAETTSEEETASLNGPITISNPLEGDIFPLEEVKDPTFAAGILGQGYAVLPKRGEVYAPFDGTVETLMDTHHALGLISTQGTTLLIHVGLETVSLNGKYFTPHVKQGDSFKKGALLLSFDLESLKKEGFDTSTPVIVTNTDDYEAISLQKTGDAIIGESALVLTK